MVIAPDADYVSPASYSFSIQEQLETIGQDFSPVGLGSNRPSVTKLLELCDRQGYVDRGRPFTSEELFHKTMLDT